MNDAPSPSAKGKLGPFKWDDALQLDGQLTEDERAIRELKARYLRACDLKDVEGVRATGASKLHEIVWGVIPQVAPLVADAGGAFAFVSSSMSQIGSVPNSGSWLYRTSKAALNMAIASAQHDYPNATLITIDPGWVQTDMGGAAAPLTPEQSASSLRKTLSHVLEQRDPKHRGAFLNHDGSTLPW